MAIHIPSEHHIKGQSFDAEIQLLHESKSGGRMNLAILVLEGSKQATFDKLINSKLSPKNPLLTLAQFNPQGLLPRRQAYFRYEGSLTTPPCKEGVSWLVFQEAINLSGQQLDQLQRWLGKNSRPLQKLNGRIPLRSR